MKVWVATYETCHEDVGGEFRMHGVIGVYRNMDNAARAVQDVMCRIFNKELSSCIESEDDRSPITPEDLSSELFDNSNGVSYEYSRNFNYDYILVSGSVQAEEVR